MLIFNILDLFHNFIPTNIQVFYLFQDALAGYICRILLQKQKGHSHFPIGMS